MLELNLVSRRFILDNLKKSNYESCIRAFNLFKYIFLYFFFVFPLCHQKNYNVSIPINSIYPVSNSFKLIYRMKNAYF